MLPRVSWPSLTILTVSALLVAVAVPDSYAGKLHIGGATVSITPDRPIALAGQMHTRIAREVESPVTATALALESREGDKALDQAILISCDLVAIDSAVLDKVRRRVKDRLPEFDVQKLLLSATHTHTAPVMKEGEYEIAKDGVMQPAEFAEFLSARVAEAAVKAWQSRQPRRAGWGLGHAVVAQNRRAVYVDGHAQMYGPTDRPEFRGIEGSEDQGVEVLCFWDLEGKLVATAVNVACPSQEVEGGSTVNADFWHEVRESLRARHGKDLLVLGWTGAAGDQSPHLMYRKRAEDRMRTLRGLTRLQELSRRIVAAWEEAYEGARKEPHADALLVHKVETITLPVRSVTEAEAAAARSKVETLANDPRNRRLVVWHQEVLDRHARQKSGNVDPFKMELHVIRLGDVAIATNVFELFTEFGIQMKARSRALQTFVIQLAGPGSYVPTGRAVRGGGYSAIVESNRVGPEGGQVLTDRTVEIINGLWPEDSPAAARAQEVTKLKILLLGDSTTIGSICRQVDPRGPHLEDVIRLLLASEKDLPPAEVINEGRDGEFIRGLLDSGRYDKEIAIQNGFDYIFIRYGLNDIARREQFEVNFPKDYAELIGRLRRDFPAATIFPTTIIPYMTPERDESVNALIRKLAESEHLTVFDAYTRYRAELAHGSNMLNYRRYPIEKIPEKHREWVKPFVRDGKVVVMDNRLDAHFRELPGWFSDRHPSPAGYHVLGDESAKFLTKLIREKNRARAGALR
jgi:lysophospholipase L1-like esterase